MSIAGEPLQALDNTEPVLFHLEKICASVQFVRAERLQQFLRFVVAAKLAGRSNDLKESIIGVKVYLREPGYDPKLEPIVRNEARRLRRKLESYYLADGQNDPVVISIPLGGYSPAFSVRPIAASSLDSSVAAVVVPPPRQRPGIPPLKGPAVAGAVLLVVAVLFLVTYLVWGSRSLPTKIRPFTRYAGYEFQPSLSPDGTRVAFVWEGARSEYNLYVRRLDSDRSVRLTYGKGHDLYPAWSRDGKQIAFLRLTPAGKSIFIVPANGGPERLVCRTAACQPTWVSAASITSAYSPGPAWSQDGNYLAITDKLAPADPDGLYLLNLRTGTKERLTTPAPETGDYFPVFPPTVASWLSSGKATTPARAASLFFHWSGAALSGKLFPIPALSPA